MQHLILVPSYIAKDLQQFQRKVTRFPIAKAKE